MESLEYLDPLLRTFWYVAIPVSVIFVIQSVMTFMGGDAGDGLEADFDSNLEGEVDTPFQLFSLRNLINFLLGFSWTGIAFYGAIANTALLIFAATCVGVLFVGMFFFIIRQVQKLAEDNSFKIANTLNKMAEVYLPIPGARSGFGKVLVAVNGSVHELEAMTENEPLASGTMVKIVKVESEKMLIVSLTTGKA